MNTRIIRSFNPSVLGIILFAAFAALIVMSLFTPHLLPLAGLGMAAAAKPLTLAGIMEEQAKLDARKAELIAQATETIKANNVKAGGLLDEVAAKLAKLFGKTPEEFGLSEVSAYAKFHKDGKLATLGTVTATKQGITSLTDAQNASIATAMTARFEALSATPPTVATPLRQIAKSVGCSEQTVSKRWAAHKDEQAKATPPRVLPV